MTTSRERLAEADARTEGAGYIQAEAVLAIYAPAIAAALVEIAERLAAGRDSLDGGPC